MRHLAIVAALIALAVSADNCEAAPYLYTGNDMIEGCRLFLQPDSGHDTLLQAFSQGQCVGAVRSVAETDSLVCPPKNAPTTQGVRIVVQYLDNHPARLHEAFSLLAGEALRAGWPCR